MLEGKAATGRDNYFDPTLERKAVKILPGEFFATADGTAITTLLGSCVSVCLYDVTSGVGGMNHFMLPEILANQGATRCDPKNSTCSEACSTRYGACAMKHLLDWLYSLGAQQSRLEAKVFGAGRVMAGKSHIGEQNAAFAIGYLRERNIPVRATDLGDHYPRKVFFLPATGTAYVKRLHPQERD
ncbi:histidine kinase [Geomonas sp. RF6]|uniref:histidine kinase n=1 Tax=Geomonas sp. RF6 TaxID=2897342 RepID=UPI001E2DE099|nr:histidine kinase [Geomonas sp. RF6]UFS69395.1 histidine kinase [Geomonas sp. RF6]